MPLTLDVGSSSLHATIVKTWIPTGSRPGESGPLLGLSRSGPLLGLRHPGHVLGLLGRGQLNACGLHLRSRLLRPHLCLLLSVQVLRVVRGMLHRLLHEMVSHVCI